MDNNELQIMILALINEAKSLIKMREQLKELGEKGLSIPVIAKLSKQKSRQQLKKDLETLDKLYLSVSGKLNRTTSRKNIKNDLKALETETVKFDAEINTSELEKTLSEIANRSTTVNVDTKVGDTNGLQSAGNAIDNIGRKSSSAAVNLAVLCKSLLQLDRMADQMVKTAMELNKGLTDLRMVTGESYEDASRLVDSYNILAKELKSTTTQVLEASSEWLRQGKTLEETNELIRQSMILSKVGNMESATATQRLTSALNGYKLAASDASAVVDKLTAVDMEAAVSADGIAEALSHTASSASLAGVELDKIISYLTVVQETSQKSASVIGESFKSIFARMSKVTNGEAIDDFGEDISQVESNLRRLGIELRESATEFRDYDDVLDELGAKWKELTEGNRNQIATAFGGVYQRENFITLMNNYEKVAKYVDTAANSAGTAAEKFTAYQESVEAHYNTMIASAEALSKQTVPPELLNGFMDAAAAIMDFTAQTHLLEIALASLGSVGAVKGFTVLTARIRDT